MPFGRLLSIPIHQIEVLLAEGWSALRRESGYTDVPPLRPSLRLIGEALLDRTFTLATSVVVGVPSPEAVRRMLAEAVAARDFFEARGWLDDPSGYHAEPPPVEAANLVEDATWDGARRRRFRRLSFESGYQPHEGEPGRDRWLAYRANRTAHAYVLEHEGDGRPWLVCVHGFGMGSPLVNFSGFHSRLLHDVLGLNLIFPCLPLHGPRSETRFSGGEILAPDYLNLLHLFAQAVWDVRRTISWVRARGGRRIGLYGVSLGGYSSALVASIERGLACVIASIPVVDFPNVARDNEPWIMRRYDDEFRVDWQIIRAITHVVSPLSFRPRVPRDRRFIIGGIADRVVRPTQPRALWRHWERPEIHWFSGGHVVGQFSGSIECFLERSLRSAGMAAPS